MGNLLSFFESIDLAMIDAFINERRQETLHLEFKVLENDDKLPRNDRRTFAQALSGFANSEGGIVVWGVIAKDDEDGVDAARAKKPITNVHRLHSRFQSLTPEATSPIIDGVLHKPLSHRDGSGFLITYVPASESAPHMAKFGDDRYYKRSGDSFRKMEHFDLEDMFGRRPRPNLELHTRLQQGGTSGGPHGTTYEVGIVVGLYNSGRGLALFPSLTLTVEPPYKISPWGLDGNYRTGLPELPTWRSPPGTGVFGGGADHVVHADSVLEVTCINAQVSEATMSTHDLKLTYRIAAQGVTVVEGSRIVPGRDIVAAIKT